MADDISRPGAKLRGPLAPCDALPLTDRGFRYGMSVFESIRVWKNAPLFFAGHAARLQRACERCGFRFDHSALATAEKLLRQGKLDAAIAEYAKVVADNPRDWNTTNIICMCDTMNYVQDAEHALAYERHICRRGVLFTLEQARRFVASTATSRMWNYAWPPVTFHPERVIAGIKALGVDVSNWGA